MLAEVLRTELDANDLDVAIVNPVRCPNCSQSCSTGGRTSCSSTSTSAGSARASGSSVPCTRPGSGSSYSAAPTTWRVSPTPSTREHSRYCAKTSAFDALVAKIVAALRADRPLDDVLRRQLRADLTLKAAEQNSRWARFEQLTDRERHTLLALSRGQSVRDIARSWVLSEATVRTHVRAVLAKLEAPSQLAAVAAALSTGWLAAAS